jgi:3D (Asp-Asp-Asp) domain-containing protein
MTKETSNLRPSLSAFRPPARVRLGQVGLFLFAAAVCVGSAIVIKEQSARARQVPLAAINAPAPVSEPVEVDGMIPGGGEIVDPTADTIEEPAVSTPVIGMPVPGQGEQASKPAELPGIADTSIRYFNGRPVRPARTIMMTVTGYSPDARSCGDSADGVTASLHRVETNNFKLVAADTRILPLGSMLTIPGYDSGNVVPVLDRGGAIKGNRLDLLFPTHEQARQWGVRRIKVTVWEYADGGAKTDWRKVRDSK